jgi:peptidyl-prolyl cis-trans isomerase D
MNEVAGEIRQRIIAERASKLAKDQADALFARLGKGESLKSLADELKLEVQHAHGTGRDAVNLDSALVTAAFAMPRPIADQPQSKLVDLGGDQFALLSLEVVADADPTSVDAKTREAAKTTLMQSQASSAARDFVAALRSAVEIKVVEDRM